jgi:hypothetical protein
LPCSPQSVLARLEAESFYPTLIRGWCVVEVAGMYCRLNAGDICVRVCACRFFGDCGEGR